MTEGDTAEDDIIGALGNNFVRKVRERANMVLEIVIGMSLGMVLGLINILWSDVNTDDMRPGVLGDPQALGAAPSTEGEDFVTGLDSRHVTHALGLAETCSRVIEHDVGSRTAREGKVRVVAESHVAGAPELVIVACPSIIVDLRRLFVIDLQDAGVYAISFCSCEKTRAEGNSRALASITRKISKT